VGVIELLVVLPVRSKYLFAVKLSDNFVSALSIFQITFLKAQRLASEKGYISSKDPISTAKCF
jgi:hypothetical protein